MKIAVGGIPFRLPMSLGLAAQGLVQAKDKRLIKNLFVGNEYMHIFSISSIPALRPATSLIGSTLRSDLGTRRRPRQSS